MTGNKRFWLNSDDGLLNGIYNIFDEHNVLDGNEIVELLNALYEENEQLKEELDYYKSKCASLETGLIQQERENHRLKKTVDNLAFQIDCFTSICNEDEECKKDCLTILLKENEELMRKLDMDCVKARNPTQREKVTLEDIIGIVKTDEPTNSVELKKDLYRDTENKQFTYDFDTGFVSDNKTGNSYEMFKHNDGVEITSLLNELSEKNEQLEKRVKELETEIDDIWRKYENAHGMSLRNADWY